MCNRAVDNYAHALENSNECRKTQEMCHEAVDTCPFVFDSIPDQYKTQEMRDIDPNNINLEDDNFGEEDPEIYGLT